MLSPNRSPVFSTLPFPAALTGLPGLEVPQGTRGRRDAPRDVAGTYPGAPPPGTPAARFWGSGLVGSSPGCKTRYTHEIIPFHPPWADPVVSQRGPPVAPWGCSFDTTFGHSSGFLRPREEARRSNGEKKPNPKPIRLRIGPLLLLNNVLNTSS